MPRGIVLIRITTDWDSAVAKLGDVQRDKLAADLKAQSIPTAIYYAKPLHRQIAYKSFPVADGGLAVSEKLADEVISLPMHAYLDTAVQDHIVAAVRSSLGG